MAACGQDDALDTGLVEALRQIFALLDALVEIVEVLTLIQTGRPQASAMMSRPLIPP